MTSRPRRPAAPFPEPQPYDKQKEMHTFVP